MAYREVVFNGSAQFYTRHMWHKHIAKYKIGLFVCHHLERFSSVYCSRCAIIRTEQSDEQLSYVVVVLDYEYRWSTLGF